MPESSIVYDFEHAETLEELRVKAALRLADGWLASAEPRMIEVRMTPGGTQRRYSQAFYRHVRENDPALTRTPWDTLGKK